MTFIVSYFCYPFTVRTVFVQHYMNWHCINDTNLTGKSRPSVGGFIF